ncbi:MAG TPA: hypothetical protein VNA68_03010 [Candidatus Dormibacteraeota bacterium]|nr:hypothetical protein [Candidatus Dormibacteraeota bacterium]
MCVDGQIVADCDEHCRGGINCRWMRNARRARQSQPDETSALLQVAGAARVLVKGLLPEKDGIANLKQAVENLDEAQAIK